MLNPPAVRRAPRHVTSLFAATPPASPKPTAKRIRSEFGAGSLLDDPYPDASRLIAFVHRVQRAILVRKRGRLWAVRATVLAPLRAARAALSAAREHGKDMNADSGVSLARQFWWTWWLQVRHGYSAQATYQYRIFDRDTARPMPLFLPWEFAAILCRTIVPCADRRAAEILADKRTFGRWCVANGFAAPVTLMEFNDGAVTSRPDEHLWEPRTDLFAKWATRLGGDSTTCWRFVDDRYVHMDGVKGDFNSVIDTLCAQSKGGPVVLQVRLVNHPELARFSARALNTIRIVTTRRPGKEPHFLYAVLRLATGDSIVDNAGQQGLLCVVDAATGTLREGCSAVPGHRQTKYPEHPDTGARIQGTTMPFWKEARELALRAHSQLGNVPCIGWDVAVVEDGPVLVEGNWNPGLRLVQHITRTPLLATEYAGAYAAWLDTPHCNVDDDWLSGQENWSPV